MVKNLAYKIPSFWFFVNMFFFQGKNGQDSLIIDMICEASNPLSQIAPDRQEATQSPHPLHRVGSISALPFFSLNLGAEYGHTDTHIPQPVQKLGFIVATVPLTGIVLAESSVTALAAAACACAMDSSMGLNARVHT